MKYKKYFLLIAIFCVCFFPIRTDAKINEVWDKTLDLSDSVSASIVKVDDGVILMQYEGGASDNNVLKKYDLDGNLVKTIPNLYGANLYEVSDGFIILNDYYVSEDVTNRYVEIIKYDKDLNQVWYKKYTKDFDAFNFFDSASGLVEVDDGYIFIRYDDDRNIKKISKSGDLILDVSKEELGMSYTLAANYYDGKLVILYSNNNGTTAELYFSIFDKDLNLISTKKIKSFENKYSLSVKELYQMNNILKIPNGYVITGEKTLVLSESGDIISENDLRLVDAAVIGDNIYAIQISSEKLDDYSSYSSETFLIKLDLELNVLEKEALPLKFNWDSNRTGVALIKNTSLFYSQDDFVNVIFLNANWILGREIYWFESTSPRYSLLKYSFGDFDDKDNSSDNITDNDSGIINNIFKNPETNSIITIITFCIVILLGGCLFYYCYMKKMKNNK